MTAQEKLVERLVERWLADVEHDGFEVTGVERCEFPPVGNKPLGLVRLLITVKVQLVGFSAVQMTAKFVRSDKSVHFHLLHEQAEIAPITLEHFA